MKNNASERWNRWNWLLTNKYPYIWQPRFIDIVLDHQENLSLELFLQSDIFLTCVKKSLQYDEEYQLKRGINIDSLTLEMILGDRIPWMSHFVEMISCRVRRRFFSHPLIRDENEFRSICLDHIYRSILKYNPTKNDFERYLHKFAAGYIGNELQKERNRSKWHVSLEAFPQNGSTIESYICDDSLFSIKKFEEKSLDPNRVLKTLGNILHDPLDWDMFFQSTYRIKTCCEIARDRGLSQGAITHRMHFIRKRLLENLSDFAPSEILRKSSIQIFGKHFSSAISEETFLEKVPRPA